MSQASLEVNTYSREDTLPQKAPELTTSDVVILGEDSVGHVEVQKPSEDVLRDGVNAILQSFDGWLSFKVKNELITQIYQGRGADDLQINIRSITDIVHEAIVREKDQHFQDATRIENENIPLTKKRAAESYGQSKIDLTHDIERLEMLVDVNYEVAQRIEQIEATGDEGIQDLSENYIQLMEVSARDAVLQIVTSQKQELEAKSRQDAAKIDELEDEIDFLSLQLQDAQAQLDDRESEPAEQELTLYSAYSAPKLAA